MVRDSLDSQLDSEYKPEAYFIPADKTFNLEIPTIDTVHRLLKTIDEKKSPGLDKIPNKLLKIGADVILHLL